MRIILTAMVLCFSMSFDLFAQQGGSEKELLSLLTKMEKDSWVAMKDKTKNSLRLTWLMMRGAIWLMVLKY